VVVFLPFKFFKTLFKTLPGETMVKAVADACPIIETDPPNAIEFLGEKSIIVMTGQRFSMVAIEGVSSVAVTKP
jgi:hypothetical protein